MSDYLWDRTGEADPEVERLEKLLGSLAHRPRPLELPAAAPRARRFRGAHLAAAAALLLAVLAGAFVALRAARRDGRETLSEAAPRVAEQIQESAPSQPTRDEAAAPREVVARQRQRPRGRAPRAAAARRPEADARGLEAKEQLVYALRLTGTKLEEVRRRVRGVDETEVAPAGRGGSR